MKKLKHIIKLDQYGCSIACIAMITNKSYFEIRDIVHKNVSRLKNKWSDHRYIGLYPQEMLDTLKSIFKRPCKFIKFSSLRKLKKHCILFICSIEGERTGGHAIIFDTKARRILDPDNMMKNLNGCNVFCCIEIQ